MSERPTSLLIEPQTALDAELNEKFGEFTSGAAQIYADLQLPKDLLEERKRAFYDSDCQESPNLRPIHLDGKDLERKEEKLLRLKHVIIPLLEPDAESLVAQAYRWRVNELIANVNMAQAALDGSMREFRWYNSFVYGAPRIDVSQAIADWFSIDAEKLLDHESAEVREMAEATLTNLSDYRGDSSLLIPDPETFRRVKEDHYREGGYYTLLLAGVELPQTGKVKPDVGEPALQQVLDNLGGNCAIENASGKSWSTDNEHDAIKRPEDYDMPVLRFIGLGLGHEIGSHRLEYLNGMRSAMRLLASGLDRYELGNEGRAVIREQVPYESFSEFAKLIRWTDILRRHLAIALTEGALGPRREFKEVYAIVNAIDCMRERAKQPDDIAKADKKANDRTWDLLATRTHRGTDGTDVSFRKDKVYAEGNVADWAVGGQRPEAISEGDMGKFDIASPRHRSLLQSLGVLTAV